MGLGPQHREFLKKYHGQSKLVEAPTERISEVIPWTKQVGVEAPTQRISEEIPWTKQVGVEAQQREFPKKFHGQQVGVGEKTGDNEFYPSLAFILIREFTKLTSVIIIGNAYWTYHFKEKGKMVIMDDLNKINLLTKNLKVIK